jgi:hypothetical protein
MRRPQGSDNHRQHASGDPDDDPSDHAGRHARPVKVSQLLTGGSGGTARQRLAARGERTRVASRPTTVETGSRCKVRTENVDLVLSHLTADECNDAAEEWRGISTPG